MDLNITTTTVVSTLTTTTLIPDTVPSYVGFIALTISILFFGSNYLPVKQFETGDGMFFQLILTTAIWTVGFVVYAIRGFPTFYALPMLGGFFWVNFALFLFRSAFNNFLKLVHRKFKHSPDNKTYWNWNGNTFLEYHSFTHWMGRRKIW